MKKLFILLCVIATCACSKVANHQPSDPTGAFFSSPEQVSQIVSKNLKDLYPGETVQSIDRISYLHSGVHDYAFVFYTSSIKGRSLVVKKNHGTQLNDAQITSCAGYCDCKVKAIIGEDGSIDIGCSCTNCKVVTSNLELGDGDN